MGMTFRERYGVVIVMTLPFCEQPFFIAAQTWLEGRRLHIGPRTWRDYAQYIKALETFFGLLSLNEIARRPELLNAYQRSRHVRVGNVKVNHEMALLQRVMKRAKLWKMLADDYQALPVPVCVRGRALTVVEELTLRAAGLSRKRWRTVYYAYIISRNTTAGPGELQHVRLKDVDLVNRSLYIVKLVKNRFRPRRVTLNDEALPAIEWLLERAKSKGSVEGEHYLFPLRRREGGYDPTMPMTTFRRAWEQMTRKAGLKGLRFYDAGRHTAITDLLEIGTPEQIVCETAGWKDGQCIKLYSHQRLEAKREWLDRLGKPKVRAASAS